MDQAERERMYRPLAFDKMEGLVREMQDPETGVPVRSQKLFLTSIPSAFMGYDLIEWLMERLNIEESVEAVHIANQLCNYGYFFPVSDSKNLVVKDDGSLYRFQTPYYWPWQNKTPDNVEYAIYLNKRTLRNRQRHGLEDYEIEALASLKKNLANKWDLITMQAEEQVRLAKERKKGDKIVSDSQERAYWRVYRPPPGYTSSLEPVPGPNKGKEQRQKRRTEELKRELEFLQKSLSRTRIKLSVALENLIQNAETFMEYDSFFTPPQPSNPWLSDDPTFWILNSALVDVPTEKRVRRWALSMEETMADPKGIQEFTNYLRSEYSHENIRFCMAVNDLRRSAQSQITKKVETIYEEFLAPGAPCEINIDGKTMEKVQQEIKNPSRFTFDCAAEHIYTLLLKKDTYPRFLRSDLYKNLLANAVQPSQRRRFFGFGGAAKKKSSTTAVPNATLLQHQQQQQSQQPTQTTSAAPLTRRRGSDRSLTGSAHDLALSSAAGPLKVVHSHSQSNLSDTPYRGDLPCQSKDSFWSSLDPAGGSSDEAETGKRVDKDDCCPWESRGSPRPGGSFEEDRRRKLGVAGGSALPEEPWEGDKNTLDARPSRKNSNQFDSGSSSSELSLAIVEVSERLRRSCVTQQASIAAVEESRVRRLSTASSGRGETSRRASVAAPRTDLRISPERPSSSTGLEPRQTPESTRPSVSSAEDIPVESLDVVTPAKTDPEPDSIRTITKGVCGKKRSSLVAASTTTPLISVSSVSEDAVCEATPSTPDPTGAVPENPPLTAAETGDAQKPSGGGSKQKDVVCPWEDEENCKVDAPFVKTYATLGYL